MLHPVHDDGPGRAVEDEAGDAQGVGVGVHVRAHHHELVVGHPRHDVGLAAGHRQPAGHLARHLLGGARPELLAHVLPPVELDEQHRQRAAGALRAGQGLVQLVLEQRPVGRLGEHLFDRRGAMVGAATGAAPPGRGLRLRLSLRLRLRPSPR